MMRRAWVILLAVVLSPVVGCGSAPASPRAPSAPRTITTVAALATDQACTRHAAAGAVLRRVALRADDVAAMTLPKSALGSRVSRYDVDWLDYGYVDNVEMAKMQLGPKDLCALNRTHGRIGGFSRAFWALDAQTVWTATHVFFSPGDAAAWLSAYVDGMKRVAGTHDVRSVRVTSMASTLGAGAARLTITCSSEPCLSTHILFRRGSVVGSVFDHRRTGVSDAINVTATAKALAARISARTATANRRAADPVDLVVQQSAGLPKSALGARYAGLRWDWFYGGCWDVAEAATQTESSAAAARYRAEAAKYGQLTYCRAMYWGENGPVNGVERAFTGGTLYATAAGASGSIAQTLADWKQRAGRTVDGTTYGRVTTFGVGSLGDQRLGLQQKVGTTVTTRVLVRHGRYVAVAAMNARSFTGMTAEVKRWAAALDVRVRALLTTRRV